MAGDLFLGPDRTPVVRQQTCSRSSQGGSLSCDVAADDAFNVGVGHALASASIGYVSVEVEGVGNGTGGGFGKAFAHDSNEFMIPGTGQIYITGEYLSFGGCGWVCATFERITQAGELFSFPNPPFPLIQLPFAVHRGVPFEIALDMSAFASGGPGDTTLAIGSLQLKGFFDREEHALSYVRLPEPSTFWQFAFALMALLTARVLTARRRLEQ